MFSFNVESFDDAKEAEAPKHDSRDSSESRLGGNFNNGSTFHHPVVLCTIAIQNKYRSQN